MANDNRTLVLVLLAFWAVPIVGFIFGKPWVHLIPYAFVLALIGFGLNKLHPWGGMVAVVALLLGILAFMLVESMGNIRRRRRRSG